MAAGIEVAETTSKGKRYAWHHTARKTKDAFAPEDLGQFYFREAILDELDRYMHYIARMKTADADTYALYSRIGARILPQNSLHDAVELEPWFRQELPTFGCIALCVGSVIEKHELRPDGDQFAGPRFIYFVKYNRPPAGVQRYGAVYVVTAYFDFDLNGHDSRYPIQFAVGVLPNGEVKPLRVLVEQTQAIRHRKGGKGMKGGDRSVVMHQRWGIPPYVQEWATTNPDGSRQKLAWTTPGDLMRGLFIYAANSWASSHASMINVMAKRGNLTAAFGVDIKRTPYFFRDREVTLNARGRKARIFHVVRPHTRTLRDGRTLSLKMHFRGLRRFHWKGYEIHVSVPGVHHLAIHEFNVGANDSDARVRGQLSEGVLGRLMAHHVREGWKTIQRIRSARVGHV